MILKKLMPYFPDKVWVDVTEQSTDEYKHYIGRAPKLLIKGPVLNYDVLEVKEPIEVRGNTIQRVLVQWRRNK
ncbi:hypothetical protein [Lactococcus lactis]|uniref:hypothetical protein n=1 Tax=Lactococcus lactis TaxID=1358 RepID=UPI00289320D4|nr:hypothetical protein [Lactococcus lactis]